MRFQTLRRAGALVLALVLALTLTVPVWAAAVTGVTLNKTALTMDVGDRVMLTATVTPNDAGDKTVTWSSSDSKVATVSEGGTVTAVSAGKATVTATTTDGEHTATCAVTVNAVPINLQLVPNNDYTWRKEDGALTLTAYLTGDGLPGNPKIHWTVARESAQDRTNLPVITSETTANEQGVASIAVPTNNPGNFIFTASYTQDGKTYTDTRNVTISGIVLSGTRLNDSETGGVKDSMKMYLNESTTLILKRYGAADDGNTAVDWITSDSNVVYVMGGTLTSQGLGKAVITATTRSGYSAQCSVEVVEDKSVIAGPYTASVSKPLKFGDIYDDLDEICYNKTKEYGDSEDGYGLKYINNLKVSTSQGTLYYNYSSEADTGRGIAATDQFAKKASGNILSADRLFFVPRAGFVGTAEITFNAVATNNRNFSGVIKVNVGMGSGGEGEDGEGGEYTYQISYRTRAGEPAWFLPSDFNAFCQSVTGRNYNYITFSLPKSSEGVLYYNYVGGTGNPVTTTMKFTPSGVYTIDDVCFVPNAAFEGGSVTIGFRAVDSAGETANGTVEVEVIAADVAGDPSNVTVSGERGKPVTLWSELFNDACRDTINDTLSFVIFKLPDPREGVLYYNYQSEGSYESRVSAGTRYYYSGVPGINNITFVPGPDAVGRVAISYTGYGSSGTSFAGTLYIGLDEVDSSTIRYSVAKNDSVYFRASDFYNACLYQKGVGVDYVTFDVSDVKLGTLRYDFNYNSSSVKVDSERYYYSPSGNQRLLNQVFFLAGDTKGIVTIPYTAYCGAGTSQQSFTGKVVIQVGAVAAPDVNVSCSISGQVGLSSSALSSACGPLMSGSLSYIEITGGPAAEEGHLYLNYGGFGTGTAVKPGDRFYRVGSPGIDRLTFIPHAGFIGEAEITYIGYSGDGQEQVSGRVMVSVYQSRTSQYFNDMSGHVWAIDAVDYLYRNGTAKGTGDGGFNPGGTITRGDFTLMLVRAYGFTASGSASFNDVPANSYYADAIRTAYLLGIVNGYNGNFAPQAPLTRQDAMVIIYNALNASGKTTTNGLSADFSIYHDEKEIASYAREAMGSLVQMGVVKGNGSGYLQPRKQLTRAEAAVLLHAIMTL